MKNTAINILILATLVAFGVLGRLLPHMPNFAPIGAIALFGGAYLNKKWAIPAVIGTMLASDLIMGYRTGYFLSLSTMSVYVSFVVISLIGLWLKNHKTITNTIFASLGSSILFFIVTNAAVWAQPNSWYPRGIEGFFQSLYMGLPFFRNTLMGDLFYNAVLFGGFELMLKAIKNSNLVATKE